MQSIGGSPGGVRRVRAPRNAGELTTQDTRSVSDPIEEENAPRHSRLHQSVNLINHRERLARSGSHCDEHISFTLRNGVLDGGVCFDLVVTQTRMVVRGRCQPIGSSLKIMAEHFAQGVGRVEVRDFS